MNDSIAIGHRIPLAATHGPLGHLLGPNQPTQPPHLVVIIVPAPLTGTLRGHLGVHHAHAFPRVL